MVARAQVFHLAPIHRLTLPKGDPVMTVRAIAGKSFDGNGTISVTDDRLILVDKSGRTDIVPLANRDIRDVVNEIRDRHGADLTVRTPYPLHSTRFIGGTPAQVLATSADTPLPANTDEAELGLGFGAVLALAEDAPDDANGLLSNTGFQLDLSGSYQVVGPRPSPSAGAAGRSWRQDIGRYLSDAPLVYLQARLGLAANQQLQISTDSVTPAVSTTDSQFEDALEQADQVALSLQSDLVLPIVPGRLDFVASPLFAVSWSMLSDPGLPTITIRDSIRAVEELFDPVVVTEARRALRQTLPLSEFGVQGTLQFRRHDRPLFYVGAGLLRREITQPRISFRRDSAQADPDRTSLRARLETPDRQVWRAFFGARLAGVLDLRVDAAGPVGIRSAPPLLKVLIGRAFPTASVSSR